MNKSVSATDLSKMVYCEATVIMQAKPTKEDLYRMKKGREEHSRFEQSIKRLCARGTIKAK